MRYPSLSNIPVVREMITRFSGLNHQVSCQEGFFYDMTNMTTKYFPVLSTRDKRGRNITFSNLLGIMDKDGLVWVDKETEEGVSEVKLYIDNVEKNLGSITLTDDEKTMCKMGAYIVIFPDKVWYNTKDDTCGYMDNTAELTGSVSFTLCGADGTAITWHDESYYESHTPANGDYKMSTINGKTSLSVYSKSTGLWSSVATTYIKIEETGIGTGFEAGDGVKVSIDTTGITWADLETIFPSVDEDDASIRFNTFAVKEVAADYITVPALLSENKTMTTTITLERKAPDMAFVVECQNRLWGCSKDGHEIYCCKLGDVKNWNVFAGISTDSWAATIGSDGVFTGAITYMGYPIFFKEESLIRVSVSSIGAHSTKETVCRGVQEGSEKSLVQLNEVLYYKSANSVCSYDGSFPQEVSEALGEGSRYTEAVGGSFDNRYYINMKADNGRYYLYCYDAKNRLWSKEDTQNIQVFVRHDSELFFVSHNVLWSVGGSHVFDTSVKESDVNWMCESGNIGFGQPDKKFVSKLKVRMSIEPLARAEMFISYDDGEWMHQFSMAGKGTQTFEIPVKVRRCDHYRYKFQGKGGVKIYSITKSYEEGSDT